MIERVVCPVLVGREEELSRLEDALLAAARGEGCVVAVSADAGLGKTRLANELRRRAGRIGCKVLWGGCAEGEMSLPYLPFLEAIGNHLRGADTAALRERLGPQARDLGRLFPQLDPERAQTDDGGDLAHAKLRLFEAILAVMQVIAEERPLLVVAEDVHWADASTRELLDYLARQVRSLPVMVLATYRGDEVDRQHPLSTTLQGWRRGRLADRVDLPPLDANDVGAMVCAIFDESEVSQEFRDYLHQRSEGNPFALEELLKEAIDSGGVYRTEDGWDRKEIAEFRLPQAVADAILMRVARLDADTLAVLQAAAALGRSFTYPALATIADLPMQTVTSALQQCVANQLIEEDPQARGGFRFRHALTKEAVYQDLIAPRREDLHVRAAAALRGTGASNAEVAYHLFLGNRPAEAVPLCLLAADEAMRGYAAMDAIGLYQRALLHVTDPGERGHILSSVGEALWRTSDLGAAEQHLDDAVRLLNEAGETAAAAHARLVRARCAWELGRRAQSQDEYAAVRDVLEPLGPSEDLALVCLRLAVNSFAGWDTEGAAELARHGIEVAEEAGCDALRIWGHTYLGMSLCQQGRTQEGLDTIDWSTSQAEARGLYWLVPSSLFNGVNMRMYTMRTAEIPDRLARLHGMPGLSPSDRVWALGFEAQYHFVRGNLSQSLACMDAESVLRRATGQRMGATEPSVSRAWIHLHRDELQEARGLVPPLDSLEDPESYAAALAMLMASELAEQRNGAAADLADRVLAVDRHGVFAWVSEAAVEAFVSSGRLVDAHQLVESAHEFRDFAREPFLQRALGRIALAEGKVDQAVRHLDQASTFFADAEETLQDLRTRVILAVALSGSGQDDAARMQLETIEETAKSKGLTLLARRAREVADELGITLSGRTGEISNDASLRGDHVAEQPADEDPAEGSSVPAAASGVTTVVTLAIDMLADTDGRALSTERSTRMAAFLRWAGLEALRHGGALVASTDTGLTATFAGDDGVLQAVEAAVALRDKGHLGDLPIALGLALAAAPEAPAVTAAQQLAVHLQSAAGAHEILADDDTHRVAASWLGERGMWSSIVPVAVDGGGTVPAYRLQRRGAVPTLDDVEALLVRADEEWRTGRAAASATAASSARGLARRLGDAGLEKRSVAAMRRTGAVLPGVGSGESAGRPGGLSERELEVVRLVADGFTNAQIAHRIHLSEHTVAKHVGNVLGKLELRSRAQVAAWASERGLLDRS